MVEESVEFRGYLFKKEPTLEIIDTNRTITQAQIKKLLEGKDGEKLKKNLPIKDVNKFLKEKFGIEDWNQVEEKYRWIKAKLPTTSGKSGIYLWVVDGDPIYIGQALDLYDRFNRDYLQISPKNLAEDGQATNLKMNYFLLLCILAGVTVDIYFYEVIGFDKSNKEERKRLNDILDNIESDLIKGSVKEGVILLNDRI